MSDVDPKKLNFIALATMPLVAVFSSSIAIEVDLKSIATIFGINLIPMLISSGIGYLLLRKASTNAAAIVSIASPVLISFSASAWYIIRLLFPDTNAPGIEHLAMPQYILVGAVVFGILSVPVVFRLNRR
ncbi:uncharacterized protein METZ01_LOCUS90133 [marine metagenome]|uniref:Uncharacterized protein n=1 Tax=marine metagenome TaxID=408172 RepID=A0A381VA88_9ZZZZ